jgi:hypothetical protein
MITRCPQYLPITHHEDKQVTTQTVNERHLCAYHKWFCFLMIAEVQKTLARQVATTHKPYHVTRILSGEHNTKYITKLYPETQHGDKTVHSEHNIKYAVATPSSQVTTLTVTQHAQILT